MGGKIRKSVALLSILVFLTTLNFAATLNNVIGKASIFRQDEGLWQQGQNGTFLTTNTKVKCEKNSRAEIQFANGHRVRLYPNSEVVVAEDSKISTRINIAVGKLRALVKKLKAAEKFEIKTPVAVCAVRGTDFSVEVRDNNQVKVEVYEGRVAAVEEATGQEREIPAGSYSEITPNQPPSEPQKIPAENITPFDELSLPQERQDNKVEALNELVNEISREQVLARAAEEIKLAEYQNGKALIDVNGNRVRLEEYIVRPTPNQFKYVVLNTRGDSFNFGKMWFVFNKDLPRDLTQATKNMFHYDGTTPPEWYVTDVGSVMSNTIDQINEIATDGNMVPNDVANPTSWDLFFKHYVFAVNKQVWWEYEDKDGNNQISPLNEIKYYDTAQKTTVSISNGDVTVTGYYGNEIPAANITSTLTMPSGSDAFHFRQKDTYGTNQWIQSDEYIINDNGKIYTVRDLTGLTSEQLKEKAYQANFERIYEASVFGGRKIDLVFSAKLLLDAGILSLPNPRNVSSSPAF